MMSGLRAKINWKNADFWLWASNVDVALLLDKCDF